MTKEKRFVTERTFVDDKLHASRRVKRTVYRRKDGSEYVRDKSGSKPVECGNVDYHVRRINAINGADFINKLKASLA